MQSDFSGKTALILGVAQNVGGACAHVLAKNGLRHLLLADRQWSRLSPLANLLKTANPRMEITILPVDPAEPKSVLELAAQAMEVCDGIPDYFISALGAADHGTFLALQPKDTLRVNEVKTTANTLVAQAFLASMQGRHAKGGLLFLSSAQAYGTEITDPLAHMLFNMSMGAMVSDFARASSGNGNDIRFNALSDCHPDGSRITPLELARTAALLLQSRNASGESLLFYPDPKARP